MLVFITKIVLKAIEANCNCTEEVTLKKRFYKTNVDLRSHIAERRDSNS